MYKIKKLYNFSNKRQIWRLLPTENNLLIIEERDKEKKEVYFNCINIISGKEIFSNLQLEEKYWLGIETVYDNKIYFHKFTKPDMPGHKGIIALNIATQQVIWENPDLSFLFLRDNKVYCYTTLFEGRNFKVLNSETGEVEEELGSDTKKINEIREKVMESESFEGYKFAQPFDPAIEPDPRINRIINDYKTDLVISGPVEFIKYYNILLFNFHEVLQNGKLRNNFKAVDIDSGKIIFDTILINESQAFVPDSFFVKNELIFMLVENVKLVVCLIKNNE